MRKDKTDITIVTIMFMSVMFLTLGLFSRQVKILKHIEELEKQVQSLEVYTDILSGDQARLESEVNNYLEKLEQHIYYEVAFGYFVGINVYGERGYHVILIDGKLYETIGNENYIFAMNERAVVIAINNVLYSTPLREGLNNGEH